MGLSAALSHHVLMPLADVWLQVGVWVAAMLALFSVGGTWADRITGLLGRRGWGPVAGALLGVSPGCGGAILVMPVHAAGRASFGTVVATLVATMGDSSFVILAANPRVGLALHGGLLALGAACGLTIDALGIAPDRRRAGDGPGGAGPMVGTRASTHVPAAAAVGSPSGWRPAAGLLAGQSRPAVSTVGAARMPVGLLGRPAPVRGGLALWLFWGCVAVGLAMAVVVQFGGVTLPAVAGLSPWQVLGVGGTLFAVLVTVAGRRHHVPQATAPSGPTRARMAHTARETAAVTTWVAAAFLVFQVVTALTGDAVTALLSHGLLSVLLAAVIGLVPGCGPQILLTTLYTQGAVGVPALLANAISQDGDALFPLLARDRGAALWATVATTVPALFVGGAAWLLIT